MREMRRKDRKLSEEQTQELLQKCQYGVLAVADEQRQAYGVPLSYVVLDNCIYFHCAQKGQKLDNIRSNPKVCFTVVDDVLPVYDDDFSTYYKSAIVFGTACEVLDAEEKEKALYALCEKYLPEHTDKAPKALATSAGRTTVYKIHIEQMSGKGKLPTPPSQS